MAIADCFHEPEVGMDCNTFNHQTVAGMLHIVQGETFRCQIMFLDWLL